MAKLCLLFICAVVLSLAFAADLRQKRQAGDVNDALQMESKNKAFRRCMRHCPSTSEYNPVCGSDGITYSNPGRLMCAQECGRDVKKVSDFPCP